MNDPAAGAIPWIMGGAALAALAYIVLSIVTHAIDSLSRVALHRLGTDGDGHLDYISRLREVTSPHRAATSLARQLALLSFAALAGLATRLTGWPLADSIGAVVIGLGAVVVFDLMFARIVAAADSRLVLRRLAFVVRLSHAALLPIVLPAQWVVTRLASIPSRDEEREENEEEEVEAYIEVGEREGILEAAEGAMMRSIVDLGETRVREIMTPRPDIVALPSHTTVDQARRAIIEAGHSRLPVFGETIDEIVGVLHVRDLLRAWEEGATDQPIGRYLREVKFVPEPLAVAELLGEMRVRSHIAIVVDEYGGVAGLVTLEDLLEEIVGDIQDEHDLEEAEVHRQDDGSWIINASLHVEDVEELFDLQIGERDFDTLGGLIVSTLGRVPAVGESFDIHTLHVTVLKGDQRRIRQVRVVALDSPGKTSVQQ